MTRSLWPSVAGSILLAWGSIARALPPGLQARHRTAEVVIDGKLDEPDWRAAPVGADFVQRQPTPGLEPPVPSEVRVLFDEDALYVGVRMQLMPGEVPRGLNMQRDSFDIYSDDAVSVKIDIRRDRRTTVGFVTNPVGAQLDYMSLENGAVFRVEYDAVWQVATHVTEHAWYAEFRLPAAALGAADVDGARIIGFNVTRDHNGRGATDDWALLPPEMSATAAANYGELRGVDGLGGGRPLILNPYVLGGYLRDLDDPDAGPWRGKAGGNIRLRLAPDLWGEVTLFTDFAEVDVDDAILNLSRFPVTLPERRPFFLSGLDVFEMGFPGVNQLFFSRRIGLGEGIYGGAKLYGRTGGYEVGFLSVVTEPGDVQPISDDADHDVPDAAAPASSWTVARVRYNFDGRGHVGTLLATRQTLYEPEPGRQASRSHYAGAVDVRLRSPDGRWDSNAFGAFTFTPRDAVGPGEAADSEPELQVVGETAGWRLAYRGAELQPFLETLLVSEDFDPQVGFVRRRDTIRLAASLPYIMRPRGSRLTRSTTQANWRVERAFEDGEAQGYRGSVTQAWEFESRWVFSLLTSLTEDHVTDDFDLADRVTIAGRSTPYRWVDTGMTLSSPFVRNPSFSLNYYGGTFYDGNKHEFGPSLSGYISRHFRYEGRATVTRLDFSRDHEVDPFYTAVVNARATIAITPRLFFNLIGNYSRVSERWNLVARMRWRYWPGSDLIAVYQERLDGLPLGSAQSRLRLVTVKLSHRFDALL